MDDYCKTQNVFLSNDDRIKHTVDKSKSQFKLFRTTVDKVFQKVKVYPEVPGLDIIMENNKRMSQQ